MATPRRLYLVHLHSSDTVSAQFNPTELREALKSVWRNVEISGESGEPLEYDHTGNFEFSLELGFNRESGRGITFGGTITPSEPPDVISGGGNAPPDFKTTSGTRLLPANADHALIARRFLLACQFQPRGASTVRQAAPSALLLVWPNFISMKVRLTDLEFTHKQWESTDGPPVLFTASCKFESVFERRLYYEDVLEYGTELHDGSGSSVGGA